MNSFNLIFFCFSFLCFCNSNVSCGQKSDVSITFKVVPKSIPAKSKIFISGNHEKLGNWNASAVPMIFKKDGSFSKKLSFEVGTHLEYKFTLGTWATEALDKTEKVPPNFILDVKTNATKTIFVNNWKTQKILKKGQVTGKIKIHHNMKYEGILPRDVFVWLPKGYEKYPEKKFPVLYMHDGQQLFDPSTSTHGVDWQVDETVTKLVEQRTRTDKKITVSYPFAFSFPANSN